MIAAAEALQRAYNDLDNEAYKKALDEIARLTEDQPQPSDRREVVAKMCEEAMGSPASGPVVWTEDRWAGMKSQAAFLASSIDALYAAPTPPQSERNKNDDPQLRMVRSGPDGGGARQTGVASGDVPGEADLRGAPLRAEKRCFTYCGPDKCDCECAEFFEVPPFSQDDIKDEP
jgi:hypothetical protein